MKPFAMAMLALCVSTTPGFALSPKIFLASTGDDVNDGSRAAPKRSLQAAHDGVSAGGEVVILDTAGYGPVTINKSVGIVVPPGVNGFITVGTIGGKGVQVNAASTDTVTLRGLVIEGLASNVQGRGIQVTSVGTLVVEDTTIRNFFEGIYMTSPANALLVVRGGAVRNTAYGIEVYSGTSSVKIDALTTDTEFTRNVQVLVTQTGVSATNAAARVAVTRCAVSGSMNYVFQTSGTGAETVVDGCAIAGNNIVFSANSGGVIETGGNNRIFNNTSLGATPTPLGLQ